MRKILCVLLIFVLSSCGSAVEEETTVSTAETTIEILTETTTETTTVPPLKLNPKDPEFYVLLIDNNGDVNKAFQKAPRAYINIYAWGEDYMPEAYAQVILREGDGFYVRMYCKEDNPLAVNTNFNDPIYEDSCLEFFVSYMPEISNQSFINTEMNANGAFLCYYVTKPGDYTSITNKIKAENIPIVVPLDTVVGWWGVELYVKLEVIEDVYGTPFAGDYIRCNFYKCGDRTAVLHYGAWSEVKNATPNFHMPDYFADVPILR